jgi:glycosyltransferase involved in cell wall biosynthesis
MDKQPLVSIIIVTFNAEKTLQKALDSIFEQQYPHIETIIIDGLSTDQTVDILKANDAKITFWQSEKDEGIYDAMNKALNYVKGDRVFFLGADDFLLPDFSEIIPLCIDKNTIYYAQSKFKKRIEGKTFKPYNLSKRNIVHQSIFYPKSVFCKFKYELKYSILADYYLNIKCFSDGDYTFKFVPIIVSVFTAGGVSGTQKDIQFELDKDKIVEENFNKSIVIRYKLRKFKKKIGL